MNNTARVLVAGHGSLPAAMVASARMIGGELANLHSIGLEPGQSPQELAERFRGLLESHNPNIVLTDLAGGTPHNVARLVLRDHPDVALISSVSLPLLLELAFADAPLTAESLDEAISATGATLAVR
ncbi:PTS sugar transporter subunit IIA [Humidisolicoccus flavus]|uniref:PTS sugar transporter subunit IIA n=1 Tax=Humidisolicoccus flavus TaxID=3111414 RepID=UPI003254BF8E